MSRMTTRSQARIASHNTPISLVSSPLPSPPSTSPTSDSDDDNDDNCCICLDSMSLPVKVDCGHQFCFMCIKTVKATGSLICPLCRNPISPDLITLGHIDQGTAPVSVWEYAGKTPGTFWKFDPRLDKMIEQEWNKALSHEPATALVVSSSNPFRTLTLQIGVKQYFVDFHVMKQIDVNNNAIARRIRRQDPNSNNNNNNNNTTRSAKGISGLMY